MLKSRWGVDEKFPNKHEKKKTVKGSVTCIQMPLLCILPIGNRLLAEELTQSGLKRVENTV